MSNTFRNVKHANWLRSFKHVAHKRGEIAAKDEFESEDIIPYKKNRIDSKINNIRDPWDDVQVAGRLETKRQSKWKARKVWLR
jgi:hypothetical protein